MTTPEKFFCSDLAWEHGVPLIGSATRGDIWFLLEYAGRWGAKAFDESELPQAVKDHLNTPPPPDVKVRILLIRQPQSHLQQELHFFIGQTHPLTPRLYEYSIQDYTDLLNIDLAGLTAGQPGDPAHLRDEPLYLVCTNGKRDQCCSVYGPETYLAMVDEAGQAVWQSSHIGGHNQAPVTLFFPYGVHYGHTTPAEARRLVRAYQQGKVVLHHYRGRVCFEQPVQAAEHFWREQTGILELTGAQVEAAQTLGKNEWEITVSATDGRARHEIRLQRQISDVHIPITCSKQKIRPISSFQRVG